jgi:predicted nucleic acid-binding protein
VRAYVLDASVAVKWSVPAAGENLVANAFRLLDRYTANEFDWIVPDIFWAEMGNIFWKGVRQRRWSQDSAETAALEIRGRGFKTISSQDLFIEALQIALQHNRTVYDSLYVVLAVRSSTDFITADERLANALAAYLPVKWLGAF